MNTEQVAKRLEDMAKTIEDPEFVIWDGKNFDGH
jgi:hypothetical protein